MGKQLTPEQETEILKQTIREAHEAIKDLANLVRQAQAFTRHLLTDYQDYHDREMKQLANALTVEYNQVSHDLNISIDHAKQMIMKQIMSGEAVFDAATSTVAIRWGLGAFDENVPLPYPDALPKETTQ
jgi:hypothetical protein